MAQTRAANIRSLFVSTVLNNARIKKGRNWLVWADKIEPTSALTGKTAGWNRNLATFAEARQFCEDHPEYSLGYCFSADDGFIGLDLDSCIGKDGLEEWASDIISQLPEPVISNTSVSGTGIKLIFECSEEVKRGVRFVEAQQFGSHIPQIELFTNARYFALTSPLEINIGDEVSTEALSAVMGYDVTDIATIDSAESTAGETTAEELAGLLSRLDVMNYSGRDIWFKLLSAAHHGTAGSSEGLEVFKSWSSSDAASYNEAHLERDWWSLQVNTVKPITIATIVGEVKKANPRTVADDFGAMVAKVEAKTAAKAKKKKKAAKKAKKAKKSKKASPALEAYKAVAAKAFEKLPPKAREMVLGGSVNDHTLREALLEYVGTLAFKVAISDSRYETYARSRSNSDIYFRGAIGKGTTIRSRLITEFEKLREEMLTACVDQEQDTVIRSYCGHRRLLNVIESAEGALPLVDRNELNGGHNRNWVKLPNCVIDYDTGKQVDSGNTIFTMQAGFVYDGLANSHPNFDNLISTLCQNEDKTRNLEVEKAGVAR
ncbi:PriCT-2 domain-containing protein, partial [bacterium]|nr:PriCT-2 domain-containing protein [bacterium]